MGTFAPTGQIIADGRDGNDFISIGTSVAQPSILYGSAGNDILSAGNGSSILIGGNGDDLLAGGNGQDILIGGSGRDILSGDNGEDILIAGSSSYDDPTITARQSLCGIRGEWLRTDITYQAKLNHLSGTTTGGLNGTNYLKASSPGQTVFNDSSLDALGGGNGSDWFMLNSSGGGVLDISDRTGTEVATDLP
jgi:Ca2+-binding RTX toxin-like protein